MKRPLRVLLVNPPIDDVAAYGFWSAPLGLLYVGAVLRQNGMKLTLLDCMAEVEGKRKEDGRAPFVKQKTRVPTAIAGLRRGFRRYGLSTRDVEARLSAIEAPDLVLVTSIMTYWYTGAAEVVSLARQVFLSAKIVLGGIYPSLCYDHAASRTAGADLIVGREGLSRFYTFVEESFGRPLPFKPPSDAIETLPYPAFDLYEKRPFVPLLTSIGCSYRCTYCATPYLRPRIARRAPESVLREITYWGKRGVSRFALYDDNFLFKADAFSKPLLTGIGRLPFECAFYNPNALNASLIDRETADLLKGAGFREVRLGLETTDPVRMRETGGKVSREAFARAAEVLRQAGFADGAVKAYVLAGLPCQRWEEVEQSVDYAASLGVQVNLAQYTPIPHTPMAEQNLSLARYPIAEEPLFQNNALFPFSWEGFTEADMNRLKAYARKKNRATGDGASDPECFT